MEQFDEQHECCEYEGRSDYDLEFDDDFGDVYRNAPSFRILRGIFINNKEGSEQFNAISNLIRDDIIHMIDFLLGDENVPIDKTVVREKLSLLTKKQQETVVKKAQETSFFLKIKTKKNKKSNEYKFTDMVKQVCLNLVYGTEKGGPIRYSRNGTDYSGDGLYAKMHLPYEPFIFITDAMYLLGLIENNIGHFDQQFQLGTQSRMWFTNNGRELFWQFIGTTIFDEELEHDLIIKTKIVERKNKDGKMKKYKEIVPYKDSVDISKKKTFIKKVNKKLDEQTLDVLASDVRIDIKYDKDQKKTKKYKNFFERSVSLPT